MGMTLRTAAFKKYTLKPKDMSKTVEEAVVQAVTNRSKNPDMGAAAEIGMAPRQVATPEPQNVEWPMPIEAFQYGHFLEPGDIVLSTRLESFFSMLVKRFDNSRFCHAALTFVTPRHYAGVDRSFLIEASFSGVDLGAFSEIIAPTKVYSDTREKPRYVVGIKRLEADWFTPEMRPMVSGRMLRFIKDDDYNFALLAALPPTVRISFSACATRYSAARRRSATISNAQKNSRLWISSARDLSNSLMSIWSARPLNWVCSRRIWLSRPATPCSSRPGSIRNARWKC